MRPGTDAAGTGRTARAATCGRFTAGAGPWRRRLAMLLYLYIEAVTRPARGAPVRSNGIALGGRARRHAPAPGVVDAPCHRPARAWIGGPGGTLWCKCKSTFQRLICARRTARLRRQNPLAPHHRLAGFVLSQGSIIDESFRSLRRHREPRGGGCRMYRTTSPTGASACTYPGRTGQPTQAVYAGAGRQSAGRHLVRRVHAIRGERAPAYANGAAAGRHDALDQPRRQRARYTRRTARIGVLGRLRATSWSRG
jgi:hypothetical protein